MLQFSISAMVGRSFGIRLKHSVEQRTDSGIDGAQIGHPSPLLDELKLAPAHVELLSGQGVEQHQSKTVDIGLRGDVAAEKADLFRRHIVMLAGKAATDDCRVSDLAWNERCRNR